MSSMEYDVIISTVIITIIAGSVIIDAVGAGIISSYGEYSMR